MIDCSTAPVLADATDAPKRVWTNPANPKTEGKGRSSRIQVVGPSGATLALFDESLVTTGTINAGLLYEVGDVIEDVGEVPGYRVDLAKQYFKVSINGAGVRWTLY